MTDGTFLVSISGQIEFIDILASAGSSWHCKYEFVAGPDWKVVSGLEAGLSQIANVVSNGAKIVLNLPLEIIYKSTNLYGCKYTLVVNNFPVFIPRIFPGPQIVLSVYNEMNLQGYGRLHMPLQPGVHKINVALSRPIPSSLLGYFASFFGYQPELLQPKMLATTSGNNCKLVILLFQLSTIQIILVIRMVSNGEVNISANILSQNLQSMGYDVGGRDD